MLDVHGLTNHYSAIPAVDDVSFTTYPGEVLVVIFKRGHVAADWGRP